MEMPSGYNNLAFSNDGNTVTAYHEDHTVQVPRYMIITRKRSDYNAGTATFSVPTYRVRVIHGYVNTDGVPMPEKTLFDADIRFPVMAPDLDLGVVIGDAVSFLSQEGISAEMKSFQLPNCCAVSEEP